MADLQKMAKTAATMSGKGYFPGPNRTLADGSHQERYFVNETQAYTQEIGYAASNVFLADCQGLNTEDFFEWRKVKIRSIRAAQAQTGETMQSDWQRVYIIDPANLTYLPQGAMMKYADNTWIIYKDRNIAAIFGSAVVRRCNAVINLLDYYGNIVHVPISYAKMGTLGNATHATENTITSKNYIACICQLNEYSKCFTENTRIILGKTAYQMRGLDDFTREFTDDPDSVHLLTFTIERTELQAYDSAEYAVADYYGFSWRVDAAWQNSMTVGQTQQITPQSVRNGQIVESTEENPVTYLYTSSDETVLTVDENGLVTAVGAGSAEITITLEQNPSKSVTVSIEVPESIPQYVAFTSTVPPTLHEMRSVTISAASFENGTATEEPVTFILSGPEETAYGAEINGNTMKLTVYRASPKPLVITAESGDFTDTAEIRLIT